MSLDLVWGAISMFIIIVAIGETMNWLTKEVRKLRRRPQGLFGLHAVPGCNARAHVPNAKKAFN